MLGPPSPFSGTMLIPLTLNHETVLLALQLPLGPCSVAE